MRGTLRLLAKIQPTKFLETDAPTGLTGILTHPLPRPALIYTYNQTLKKLQAIPETSIYRQSTEAITRARLKVVHETRPAGYDQWLARVKVEVEKHPAAYVQVTQKDGSIAIPQHFKTQSESSEAQSSEVFQEGAYSEEEANAKGLAIKKEAAEELSAVERIPKPSELESEPPLDADQIEAIESKIGAGLIEEVIMVADGELKLIDDMIASRVWEPLEEKAPAGQWDYFQRGTHTGTT